MIDKSSFIVKLLRKIERILWDRLPSEGTLDEMWDNAIKLIEEEIF